MTASPIDTIREALERLRDRRFLTHRTKDYLDALAALTEVEHQLAAVNEVREYGLKPAGLLALINEKESARARAVAAETALAEANTDVAAAAMSLQHESDKREAAEQRANDLEQVIRDHWSPEQAEAIIARAALDLQEQP